MARIGVALSGGGHRATVWGFGALLYLTDAGKHTEVSAISSVSGGSIANGVIAQRVDYTAADGAALRTAISPALANIANDGLFFRGPATDGYVFGLLALAGLSVVALLVTFLLGIWANGIAVVVALAVTIVLLAATVIVFARRSLVAEGGLTKVHFNTDGRPTALRDVARPVTHLFCATELQAGNHLYFTPTFVYSYRIGIGVPGDLALSTAVQCSACLPGAFAPRRLPTAQHMFTPVKDVKEPPKVPDHMLLNDGGVYDNMGDEWFAGYGGRTRGFEQLKTLCPPVDEVVIANASGGWGWQDNKARSRLKLELAGVLGSKDVLYNSSTRIRRRSLIDTFRLHETTHSGYVGSLVHIPQTPYEVADGFAKFHDDKGDRARAVIAALGDDPASRKRWDDVAAANSGVSTTLGKLGPDVTARLLHHAYVLAMCNLHVVLNYPLLPFPDESELRALTSTPRG